MPGFDLAELLPYYLDETDEQIVAMGDALLQLEQDPADAKALQVIFRIAHTVKGASTVMGLDDVKVLTHSLETLFDQFRSGARALDRGALELCFRCLDDLREYHRQLRDAGEGTVDLSARNLALLAHLEGTAPPPEPTPKLEPPLAPPAEPVVEPPPIEPSRPSGTIRLVAEFEPNLPWPDMKAKLILNRLAGRARIVATSPPVDRLDGVDSLPSFTVWLVAEGNPDDLRALADVDGVVGITMDAGEPPEAVVASAEPAAVADRAAVAGPTAVEAPTRAPTPEAVVEEATTAAGAKAPRVAETLRVDVDRLDHLMNLVGELVINKARFAQVVGGLQELFRGSNARLLASEARDRLDGVAREVEALALRDGAADGVADHWSAQFRRLREDLREILDELELIRQGRERLGALADAVHHLGRVTDGLQKGVLDTRMVPIGPLFERFRRVVRDLSVSSGKEVALRIGGEKTELDKRMIDELSDPLIHLVRNGVDHGLETPARREAAGKPRVGTVSLQAAHRGNSVVITVADDGAGIDCERLRRKVVARGLLAEDQARALPERQLISYIFYPGLSTAETITDVSGRGVGMDIVKSRIELLNGAVDVRTEPGRGTTFTIRLPLTLAIMPSLLVRIGGESYAIPLDHLDEIVEVPPARIYRVRGRRALEVRGRIIALLALSDVFRWAAPGAGGGNDGREGPLTVVVVQDGESTIGLVVDGLLGMQEMVLKSLEKNFRAVPGLSGASILGDGRVALILDVDALITMTAEWGVTR